MMRFIAYIFAATISACVVASSSYVLAASIAPAFRHPLDGSWTVTRDFWTYVSGRGWHLGEDGDGSAAQAVYAPSDGIVQHIKNRKGYGNVVIIEHQLTSGESVASVMGHLRSDVAVSVGQTVVKGQLVGYLGDSSQNGGYVPHSHFGINNGTYAGDSAITCSNEWVYAGYTNCSEVKGDWQDPTDFINSYSPLSSATSWPFTSTLDGWSLRNATDQGIYNSNYWKLDPGVDPQMISPQLSAVSASTHKILKLRMGVPGSGTDTAKVYFKTNINDSWSEGKSISVSVQKDSSATQRVYYVPLYLNPFWTGSIAQIRIDPVVNYPADNTSSIYIDYITFATLPSVQYSAHVSSIGWMGWVSDGATAGTTGRALQMEAIKIQVPNAPDLYYQAHVADIGWMNWVSNGAIAGTTGQNKRLEAIKIEQRSGLPVYYRAHVQDIGWMPWVSNGAVAGTTGRGLRIEALQIKLTPP